MDIRKIKKLIELLENSGLAEIEIKEGDDAIRISRSSAVVETVMTTPAVSAPIAGDCFGMAHFGAIFGLIFTAYGFLSGPLGPWLSGYVLDRTQGNYTLVFSYLGFMYLASAGLILMVQPWRECRL